MRPETEGEVELYTEYRMSLGRGEASSLALAICRDWAFASDDRAARRAARAAGVRVSGTVGILIVAVQTGALERAAADEILRAMRRRGYRFPIDSLEGLV